MTLLLDTHILLWSAVQPVDILLGLKAEEYVKEKQSAKPVWGKFF